MRRQYYYIIGSIVILILSYLFYQSCKRDTFVSGKNNTIDIPDSSWLTASIDLNGIRNEIAWNTLLNGNFGLLFKTDSTNNTLFQLLRSPSDFDISEQLPIYYFSKWENSMPYHGLILSMEHAVKLRTLIGGDLITSETAQTYISRTKEGIWIYNDQNLMFLFQADQDSLTALKYFKPITQTSQLFNTSDSITVSVHLNTNYIPASHCHPALDSIQLSLQILTKDKSIHTYWSYKGIFDNYAENTALQEADVNTGIYYSAKHTPNGFQTLKTTVPLIDSIYQKHKELLNRVLEATKHATIQASFNGWQQVKNSYYVSEMNDEFEVVSKKKDTSFTEPVFCIQLEQESTGIPKTFISYLQQQGLVSHPRKNTYDVILGNFDSELMITSTKGIIIQNKNTKHLTTDRPFIKAAFLFDLHPDAIKNADAFTSTNPSVLKLHECMLSTEQIQIIGNNSSEGMNGSLNITFKEDQHPFMQIIKLISEQVSEGDTQHNK